jgi:hypothetical protein
MKVYAHRKREGIADPKGALATIAEALGGVVAGRTKILAPSPGCDADDRSMVVFFQTSFLL